MKSANDIEQLARMMRIEPSSAIDDRILARAGAMLEKPTREKHALTQPNIRRTIMKSPITKLAAGAAIIAVVLVGIHLSGRSFDGSTVAWGEIVRNVEKIHTIKYRETIAGPEEKTTIVYMSPEYGLKEECYKNGQIYSIACYQRPKKMLVAVVPWARAYERHPLTERELGIVRKKRDGSYYVSRFMSVEHKQLARANINGMEVEGIQINSPEPFEVTPSVESFVGCLWFDVVTDLLVLIELEFVPAGLFH